MDTHSHNAHEYAELVKNNVRRVLVTLVFFGSSYNTVWNFLQKH